MRGLAAPDDRQLRDHLVALADQESDPCEERDYKGLHAFPFNITRDYPTITRDYPPSLLTLQGRSLTALVVGIEHIPQVLVHTTTRGLLEYLQE